jgi:cytochrome P450
MCDAIIDFNPRDDSLFVDEKRDPLFARLRERHTLCVDSNGVVPIYSLVRYADVARAYKEPDVFSPTAGLTLDAFDPAQSESLSKMLETASPERHRELRSAMRGAFRGHDLASLATKTRDQVDRFIAETDDGDVIDLVEEFARGTASSMTTELLGVGPAEATRLDPLLRSLGSVGVGASSGSNRQREKTELWLLRELTRVVRTHRDEERASGLVGRLLAAEAGEQPLTDHEVVLNCLNVVLAGTAASQHTLAGAAAAWAEHPDELEDVVRDPDLESGLIDETLRWLTPVVHLTRIVTRDVEIAGQEVPKGVGVCLWNISANRDEEVFTEATTFNPRRPARRHLAFGTGPQHCLGAQVIRTQLESLLAGMLQGGVRFELSGSPIWIRSNTITGVESLPVRIRRVG